jgi:cell division protein FtsB
MSTEMIVHIAAIAVQTLLFLAGIYAVIIRSSQTTESLQKDIKEMEEELKGLAKVITRQAVQDERLTEQGRRMTFLEQRVEDLRRGRGYVQDRDASSVDREY